MITLGIDIGTTKSAAVICSSGRLLAHASCASSAGYGTQSTAKLLDAAFNAVCALPAELRRQVSAIGITGQMHGVMAYDNSGCSELENWQSDLALKSGTLERVKGIKGCEKLASGFGFATLAVPGWRGNFRCTATVMDYLAVLLTGRPRAVTDPTNAASWGLWRDDIQDWDRDAVQALGIPGDILPEIVPSGTAAGSLCARYSEKLGIAAGIPVYVPIGDNPAAIIGSGGDLENDIYLTVGTGAQLALVSPPAELQESSAVEIRPFPGGRRLAVSASLCGGKSLELLADFVRDILREFDVDMPVKNIYDKISLECSSARGLSVKPHFLGERNAPLLRGSIDGISMENLRFHPLCRAWCEGILANLLAGIPASALADRKRIVVNGNAVRKTPLFRQTIRESFSEKEVIIPDICEEAACGAAIYAAQI